MFTPDHVADRAGRCTPSEVIHTYHELVENRSIVTITSLSGGRVPIRSIESPETDKLDTLSAYYLRQNAFSEFLNHAIPISRIDQSNFDAIIVVGNHGSPPSRVGSKIIHQLFQDFYYSGKPSAAIGLGVALLLQDNGSLIRRKTITGPTNQEYAGLASTAGALFKNNKIQVEAERLGARFVYKPPFTPFAVVDKNLITGQQHNSGQECARFVLSRMV